MAKVRTTDESHHLDHVDLNYRDEKGTSGSPGDAVLPEETEARAVDLGFRG